MPYIFKPPLITIKKQQQPHKNPIVRVLPVTTRRKSVEYLVILALKNDETIQHRYETEDIARATRRGRICDAPVPRMALAVSREEAVGPRGERRLLDHTSEAREDMMSESTTSFIVVCPSFRGHQSFETDQPIERCAFETVGNFFCTHLFIKECACVCSN